MPTLLSVKALFKSSQFKLFLLFLLSPFFAAAQSLTGLWTGTLSNDSTTVRRDQSFEIALTEYKGKVYGYSRSEFIVNDTLYYIVKRVKGTIDGDVCEVTDEEIISYNFKGKLDKGIKVTSTFRRSKDDSTWHLDGSWKTNATKKYYSVTGKVGLAEEKDLTASKIFPHLEELNLANDIAFYKERAESTPVVRVVKPEKNYSAFQEPSDIRITNTTGIAAAKPELYRAESDYVKPISAPDKNQQILKEASGSTITNTTAIAIAQPQLNRAESDYVKPITAPEKMETGAANDVSIKEVSTASPAINQPKLQMAKPDVVVSDEKKNIVAQPAISSEPAANNSTTSVKQQPILQGSNTTKPVAEKSTTAAVVNKTTQTAVANTQTAATVKQTTTATVEKQPVTQSTVAVPVKGTEPAATPAKTSAGMSGTAASMPVAKKPLEQVIQGAAVVSGRKSEFSQEVNFKSDSLVIALYDNGEIDGDTVSVYMNGQVIMARQGLKASAVKKTIYITRENEDFSLVLFADNLGKYPPNTGLLVVYDGDDTYNLRFSSDFQKNAGIVFRRKR